MCSPLIMEKVRSDLSRRYVLGALGVAALAGVASRIPVSAQEATPVATGPGELNVDLGSYTQIQDLTHTITKTFPVFPGDPQLVIEPFRTYAEHGYYSNILSFNEHIGTHMDAPAHFVEGATFANELPVQRLFAPLAVIDVSARAADDPDTQVTPDDILAWEGEYGPLPAGALVAMYSGWESRLGDPATYINLDDDGMMHFPGFQPEATLLLVEERDITGIGVDTLSLDFGASQDFATHATLLGAGKYGLENLAMLASIPAAGSVVFVGGPKVTTGSGGQSRVMALF